MWVCVLCDCTSSVSISISKRLVTLKGFHFGHILTPGCYTAIYSELNYSWRHWAKNCLPKQEKVLLPDTFGVNMCICAAVSPSASAVKIDAKVALSGFNRHFASSKKSSYRPALTWARFNLCFFLVVKSRLKKEKWYALLSSIIILSAPNPQLSISREGQPWRRDSKPRWS